ncbi:hypothetical protein HZ326_5835 [Fusarium oxysporum f. sp. albedinis]|nr:hypothetical protein HZ326_5835 [Fusarium oxysporum f. sp. albedinis]
MLCLSKRLRKVAPRCDQKFSHPRGKWLRLINVAVLDLWLLSQMSITCRAQEESVGRLTPAPDSSTEEASVWGNCHRYLGAHKTSLVM